MPVSARSNTVAVVGLGNLGNPLARALMDAGWQVMVTDTRQERLPPLQEAGAEPRRHDEILADIAVLTVPDDKAVREVMEGPHGLLSRRAIEIGIVVVSTVMPSTAQRLAKMCAANGLLFLDAPVSGGASRARAGDLTVMAGGDDDDFDELEPLLEAIGSRVLHLGKAGAGAAAKLANQVMMLSSLAGAYEAIDLANAYGVATDVLLDAVSTGTGASWVSSNWGFFPQTAREYDEAGTPVRERPWVKDLHEAVEAARANDLAVPFTALLTQSIAQRIEGEWADK